MRSVPIFYTIGNAAEGIYESFKWDEEEQTYNAVKKFENYFSKRKNVINEQAKFKERKQK